MFKYNIDTNHEFEFFEKLQTFLTGSLIAFQTYMENRKEFRYTTILKDKNERIVSLILSNCHLVPSEQRKYLFLIVNHIQFWLAQWDDLNKKLNPKPADTFFFETVVGFPKDSLCHLSEYCHSKFNITLS